MTFAITPGILTDFEIRSLTPHDALRFREVRLEALLYESDVFAASYEEEIVWPAHIWRKTCQETNENCWIGVFRHDRLIGFTAALKWAADKTGKTALFRSSYVQPEYRGEGLASKLCSARESWALCNGYNAVMLFHREGHWIAEVVQEFGGVYHHTETMCFADGSIAHAIWYRKNLQLP